MPVFIHLSCLIVEKQTVEEKYTGGLAAFRNDYYIEDEENYHQEDRLLFAIAAMDPDDFNLEKLIEKGLHYDAAENTSNDFVIVERYGESQWTLPWLQKNATFAWHIDSDYEAIDAAERINNMFMSEIKAMFDAGKNPYSTIW